MAGRVWKALEGRNLELGPPPAGRKGPWKNWRLTRDTDGVAWLIIEKADANANTLSDAVLREFNAALEEIETALPAGLVIRSAKPSGFMMGADIGEFGALAAPGEAERRLGEANSVLDRLAALRIPTVAVLHGYCLGGGLELALACRHRVAIDGARLGFPEVLLGLHPGLGGTVRSTRLIDPSEAMTLMLTGKTVHARKAKALGLVDAVTEERHVRTAVTAAVQGELRTGQRGVVARALDTGLGRRFAANRMRAETRKRVPPEHYPAPYALIDLWERHGDDPEAMKREELSSFSKLISGETSQNLVRVFFLREHLKKLVGERREFGHVHVIGAGAMGGDIAAWCAWQGLSVSLADVDPKPVGQAIRRAAELYGKIGHKDGQTRDALDRLIPDLRGGGVARADVVIEAVPEKLALKKSIYAAVEPRMKPGAILATNTSSIPLETLREGLQRPERFVGLHFFNPVSRMQLVEVIRHDAVADDAVAMASAFVGRIERLPAPVASAPGFLVNRALMPYLVEAMVMVEEGHRGETIDRAAEEFGMPMGPIELADQVGLDVCLEVAEVLREGLKRPLPAAPDWLRQKVEAGELGRKTGKGFYEWKDGKPVKREDAAAPSAEISDRLILPMIDVCVACLREGIVADEKTVDASMIFGTGFAPFRGGPLHYARSRGVGEILAELHRLAERHGERFQPDPGWDRLR